MNDLKKKVIWKPERPEAMVKVAIVTPVSDFEYQLTVDRHADMVRDVDMYFEDHKLTLILQEGGGLAEAYIKGFKTALEKGADKIIEMDIGHDFRILPDIIRLLDVYDVVYTTRYHPSASFKAPLYRKAISWLGSFLGHKLLFRWNGFVPSDLTSGFIGYRREVLEAVDLDQFISKGHFIQTEMKYYIHAMGCGFVEIPIKYNAGSSSLKLSDIVEAATVFVKLLGPVAKYELQNLTKGFYHGRK